MHPGPIITMNKVILKLLLSRHYSERPLKTRFQGELLEMNVVNQLNNEDMIVGTSIVGAALSLQKYDKFHCGL